MGYSKQTFVGVSWMSTFRVFSRIVAFVRIIILARLLAPSEFGIFGIATMVLALLEILTETGINVFLVQEEDDLETHVNDAWLISIIRGVLISAFIFLTASFVASFFRVEQAMGIILLISIVPLIKGFINPAEVKFQKELQFSKEFYFRTSIFVVDSLVSVVICFITRSAIGLVFGLTAGAILEVALSFLLIKPTPKLAFNTKKLNRIFHKGKWVTLYGILNYIASEGDSVTVGRLLGAGPLGIYQLGYTISTMPVSEVSDVTNKVTFPVYSKISEDKKRLKKGFLKVILLVSLTSILMGLVIFFFPKTLFIMIFGPKWSDTLGVLKPLAVYGAIRGISGATSSLLLADKKQKYVAGMTAVRFAILAITVIPLTMFYGLVGTSISVLLSGIIELPLAFYYVSLLFKKKN